MFKGLKKNNKGQNIAEYALTISLVVGAVIAMQTYVQRTVQGRIRDAAVFLTDNTPEIGTTAQYEPYYLVTNYLVGRSDTTAQIQGQRGPYGLSGVTVSNVPTAVFRTEEDLNTSRIDGFQADECDGAVGGCYSGI